MLLHDTPIVTLVQDGKLVTRKGDHVCAQFLVHVVQSRLDQRFT
jgi:hypothetical protein